MRGVRRDFLSHSQEVKMSVAAWGPPADYESGADRLRRLERRDERMATVIATLAVSADLTTMNGP